MNGDDKTQPGRVTWGEFKQRVERAGVSDSDFVSYIDVHGYTAFEVRTGTYPSGIGPEAGMRWMRAS